MNPASDAPAAAPQVVGAAGGLVADAVTRYEARLVQYATHLLGDADRARDVVQDAFLALWLADPEKVADRQASWLFTVCRNRALDLVRRERRMEPLESAALQSRPSPEQSPPDLAEIHDEHRRVLAVVRQLPVNQQEVLRLKLQGELSYREISEITGLSESNVGYLIHVAIHAVRDRLSASDGAAPPTS